MKTVSSMWQKNGKQALHFSNKGNLKLCVNDEHSLNLHLILQDSSGPHKHTQEDVRHHTNPNVAL